MFLAAFDAAPAEGALAGLVAPGELAFAGLELDGAAVQRILQMAQPEQSVGIEGDQAAIVFASPPGAGESASSASRPTGSSTAWSKCSCSKPHEKRGGNGQNREDQRALPVKAHGCSICKRAVADATTDKSRTMAKESATKTRAASHHSSEGGSNQRGHQAGGRNPFQPMRKLPHGQLRPGVLGHRPGVNLLLGVGQREGIQCSLAGRQTSSATMPSQRSGEAGSCASAERLKVCCEAAMERMASRKTTL